MTQEKKSNVIKISIGSVNGKDFIYFVRSKFHANPKPVYPVDIGSELLRITKRILKEKREKSK